MKKKLFKGKESDSLPERYRALYAAFDHQWYIAKYLGANQSLSREEAFRHYFLNCATYRNSPNPNFSETIYLEKYPDVGDAVAREQFLCGFDHYLLFGRDEGRDSKLDQSGGQKMAVEKRGLLESEFDADWYLNTYPDAKKYCTEKKVSAFQHYIELGVLNHYSPNAWFDEEWYRLYYKDIFDAIKTGMIKSGYEHYMLSGRQEGRKIKLNLKERLESKYPGITRPVGISNIEMLESKLKPIPTIKSPSSGKRINFLVPTIDPDIMYGGYAAMLWLIRKIHATGVAVRIIICEDASLNEKFALYSLKSRPEIYETFQKSTIINCSNRSAILDIHHEDRFVVYSAWTALLAHELAKKTDSKFVFLIQEYEAIFHANDSFRAIVESAYKLPHIPIFNTDKLREFFEHNGLGIFASQNGLRSNPFVFEHPLIEVPREVVSQKRRRDTKRFLLYARPENHAARNLFEICIMALKRAIYEGVFNGRWAFQGLGTLADRYSLPLSDKFTLEINPKLSETDYARALCEYDIGMSLMMAPHPSLLPYEMASAGMLVVTNTYENRDTDFFRSVSANIIPADLTISSLVSALRTAVDRVDDLKSHIQAAGTIRLNTWNNAFNENFIKRLFEELD